MGDTLTIMPLSASTNLVLTYFCTWICFPPCLDNLILSIKPDEVLNNKQIERLHRLGNRLLLTFSLHPLIGDPDLEDTDYRDVRNLVNLPVRFEEAPSRTSGC